MDHVHSVINGEISFDFVKVYVDTDANYWTTTLLM